MEISVSHPAPEVAVLLANTIAIEFGKELYHEGQIQVKNEGLAIYQPALLALREVDEAEKLFQDLNRHYPANYAKRVRQKAALEEKQKHFFRELDLVRRAPADKDYWEHHRDTLDQLRLDEAARLQIAKRLLKLRYTLLENEIESFAETHKATVSKLRGAADDEKVNKMILAHINLA